MASSLQIAALTAFLGPTVALYAHAETYLSEADAPGAIFPGVSFTSQDVDLSDADADRIEKASGEKVRTKKIKVYKSADKKLVFIDQVLGKHEFITYAVGVDEAGKVAGIEILEYKESYGGGVRKPEWRNQFKGRTVNDPPKLGSSIKNLSGATLSSAHLTGGVRRILDTYDAIKARV